MPVFHLEALEQAIEVLHSRAREFQAHSRRNNILGSAYPVPSAAYLPSRAYALDYVDSYELFERH